MKHALILALFLTIGLPAQADVPSLFEKMESQYKGPFGLNYLQGQHERHSVRSGGVPDKFLFQAAFRNEVTRQLATEHDFYIGNLFTTNYYELMGEYVYGDAYGSHPLDHEALLDHAAEALPKAKSMVRHWVLEKHYVTSFPDTKLARSFRFRGISGSEFEQEYAVYFFNFYLSALRDEFDFLPAMLLVENSPSGESASLEEARNLITVTYEHFEKRWGARDERVRRLYKLRNAIHNQLSYDVIDQIDRYVEEFPYYRKEGHTYLFKIRKILVEYYSFSAQSIARRAEDLQLYHLQMAAETIASEGATAGNLLRLSGKVVELRLDLVGDGGIAFQDKADALLLLSKACQFLSKELQSLDQVESVDAIVATLNVIYAQGFLIYDNWEFFHEELGQMELNEASFMLEEIVAIASETFTEALEPALGQWLKVESDMDYFVDSKIKSSSLNTAALLSQKIKDR